MFYIFTFIVLILFVVIVAVLEYKNTKLEEEIELLKIEPCTEWKTFAQEKPKQYEYIIIRKRLTEVEIQYWGIINEGLQHEIFVGYFDDNDIFYGGTDNTTIVNNYNDIACKGYFWKYVLDENEFIEKSVQVTLNDGKVFNILDKGEE